MIAEFIDPAILGFILVGVMLFAIFVGFPISFTLIFLGFVFGYLGNFSKEISSYNCSRFEELTNHCMSELHENKYYE